VILNVPIIQVHSNEDKWGWFITVLALKGGSLVVITTFKGGSFAAVLEFVWSSIYQLEMKITNKSR